MSISNTNSPRTFPRAATPRNPFKEKYIVFSNKPKLTIEASYTQFA